MAFKAHTERERERERRRLDDLSKGMSESAVAAFERTGQGKGKCDIRTYAKNKPCFSIP